ncbi:MAG: hydroxymethylglutaryl-CoA lyase [Deltaproteobacteria bacterium]|nr:hydroxymethylglutaryl-CoA lyase [Deltaproteobacteria bacterium]
MNGSAGLPEAVRVVEVGPRDGLQNEARVVPLATKVAFIRELADAGLPVVEVGAFVRADRVPQMADSEEVVRQLPSGSPTRFTALVPNLRGLERALSAGIGEIAVFTAASEEFALANLGMTIEGSLATYRQVVETATDAGLMVRGYVSTCWWCPFSGAVDPEAVTSVAEHLLALGCYQVSVADTIGAATPREVGLLLERLLQTMRPDQLGVHFHDTRGTALANVLASLERGIATIDASAGGLGGCPFAPGAAGNLSTEDLVYMLEGMGISTGVDLARLSAAARRMGVALGRTLPSRYLAAGPFVPRSALPVEDG